MATTRTISETSAPTIHNWDGDVIGGAMAHWVRNDEIFDGNRITIDLDDYFGDDFDLNNMVAIVGPTVRDDLNFRIIEVDNFDDSLTLEVQDFGDYQEPGAGVWGINLGIMVVEQGVHVLSDGTAMVADKIVTNHDWAQAEFII